MDLTLRQLEAFAAVARASSFTAAGRDLRVSQSALSRTVADIERVLRVQLIERDTRKMCLTPEGAELFAVAERLLVLHRAEMNQLTRYLAGARGTVTIATLPSVAAVLLPEVISVFHAQQPEITVRILDGLAGSVAEQVTTGQADLAITVPEQLPGSLDARPFARDRFFAALPPGHRLAERERLRWADLAGEQFVSLRADSSVRTLSDAAFTQAGTRVAGLVEAGNVATVGGLVAAGLGVTALPALVRTLISFATITDHEIIDPIIDRHLCIVVPAERTISPAARRFLALLDELRENGHELPTGARWSTAASSMSRTQTADGRAVWPQVSRPTSNP